jgi:hypothetical protein
MKKNSNEPIKLNPVVLRPFDESLPFAVAPEGEGGLDEIGKRRFATFLWLLAAVSEPDEYLQRMRATILKRHPTLYLWPHEDILAGIPPTQRSPEMQYVQGSDSVPEEFLPLL